MLLHQGETFADRRQHAQGQAIDLEDAQFVEVVFVPLDDRPLGHGRVFDRHQLAQRPAGHDHAAGVLREVPREADQLPDELDQLPGGRRLGHRCPTSRPAERAMSGLQSTKMLDPLGQPVDLLGGHAQRAAHVADGGAGAVGDHFGRHAGPFAAVFLVEILQDFLAAFVLEVDVDVGGFVPLAADEPLEQEVHPLGIDGGHAQAEADGRVGRRAAALAEDAATAGEDHEVPDGEKVGLVVQLFDQLQLVLDEAPHLVGHAVRVAVPRPFPGQPGQVFHRRLARRGEFLGVLVTQLVEREGRLPGDFQRLLQGLGIAGEERGHFLRRSQVALGIGKQQFAGRGHRAAVPHGAEHVAERLPLGHVEMDVARRDQRHARVMRQRRELIEPLLIVAAMVQFGEEVAAAGEDFAVGLEERGKGSGEKGTEWIVAFSLSAHFHSPPSAHSAINPSLCAAISSSVRRHAPFSARRRPQVISRARRP